MNLNQEQLSLIDGAFNVYGQVVQRQMLPQASLIIKKLADLQKLIHEEASGVAEEERPVGISDDQFENVCHSCDKYKNKCTDDIAKKYPGKCDPILHYLRNKVIEEKGDTNV